MAIMDRVRRGEHDLSGVPGDLLPLVEACLAPDPADRPTLSAALADLQPRGRGPWRGTRRQPGDQPTMPFVLAAARDDDPTDVLDRHTSRLSEAQAVAETVVADGVDGRPTAGQAPLTAVQQAASTSYLQPVPPSQRPWSADQPPPASWQPPPGGAARLQRGLLLAGMFALVTIGFAVAPYLTTAAVGVAALLVRTWSWTVESSRHRSWRRGGRRWYDGPLAVLSAPWYLLVATGGTLMLLVWAAALAFLTGVGLLLFRLPVEPSLLVMGAVLSFALWWGPGGRRLRSPTRSLVVSVTRRPWSGWLAAVVAWVVVALAAYVLASAGVDWTPQPGPPWRGGTLLNDLVTLL
jgi:hypothetical protein